MPACSTAHIRPVRPMPVATSSATSSAPNSSASARHPRRNAASWVSIPPAACTIGSTTSAQTWSPSRSSSCAQLGEHRVGALGPGLAVGEDAGRGDHPGLEQDRPVRRVEEVDAADAHRPQGVAVVALGDVNVERPVLPRCACAWKAILMAASTAEAPSPA